MAQVFQGKKKIAQAKKKPEEKKVATGEKIVSPRKAPAKEALTMAQRYLSKF